MIRDLLAGRVAGGVAVFTMAAGLVLALLVTEGDGSDVPGGIIFFASIPTGLLLGSFAGRVAARYIQEDFDRNR